jgi:hypothetical protein
MTMYNEDDSLFKKTMHGVMKNIAYLCKRDRSKIWGKDGWKKKVVCIVSDSCEKIDSRTLSVVAAIGAYQEGIATDVVYGKPSVAHLYEFTTQSAYGRYLFSQLSYVPLVSVSPSNKIKCSEKGYCSCADAKRRKTRRSILTTGSLTHLVPFLYQTFASSTSVPRSRLDLSSLEIFRPQLHCRRCLR